MKGVLLLLVTTMFVGCSTTRYPRTPSSEVDRAKLRPTSEMTVQVDRSFSHETAAKVAREYFHTFFGDCGDVDFQKEEADAWVFRTVVGFPASKGPDIVVAKTGAWVFTKGGAVCYWIEQRWRFDASRYRTFFHNDDVENG